MNFIPLRRFGIGALAATVLISFSPIAVGASSPSADKILKQILGSMFSSGGMILSGQGSVSGVTLTFQTKATSIGSDSTLSAGILGSEEVVQLKPGKPVYIQCSTLVTLQNFCNLASPTKAEVGHWFTIAPSDSRYKNYFSKGSPSSLEQGFSISPQGFAPHATLMGATTLKGKKVLKLQATSTFWSSGSKMTKGMLYITDSTHPKLVALSPMSGTNALLYFHHAPASIVKVPVAIGPLPK